MADRGLFTNLTFRADRWANGAKAGYLDAFNVSEMKITQPDPETKIRTSRADPPSGSTSQPLR